MGDLGATLLALDQFGYSEGQLFVESTAANTSDADRTYLSGIAIGYDDTKRKKFIKQVEVQ